MFGLERWRPTRAVSPFGDLDAYISRFFHEPFMESFGAQTWTPSCDLVETNNELRITCDLPGMKKDDLEIQLASGNSLVVRGERKFEEQQDARYHRMERFYGHFTRTFALPTSVNPEGINATFKDGVLEIVIPKTESAKARKIAIQE